MDHSVHFPKGSFQAQGFESQSTRTKDLLVQSAIELDCSFLKAYLPSLDFQPFDLIELITKGWAIASDFLESV